MSVGFSEFKLDANFTEKFISIFGWILKIFLLLFMFGFIESKPEVLLMTNFVLKVGISLYLIYRYNRYFRSENLQFTSLDRKIVYSLAVYNLLISFSDILNAYAFELRSFLIRHFTEKVLPFRQFRTSENEFS